jgi:DNA-binding transcriptional ArsR family regulator
MPREVVEAIEITGDGTRTEILHALVNQGPLTTTEVAEHLGATRSFTHRHLLALERAGAVVPDMAQPTRRGRIVRWSVNRTRVRQIADTWRIYAAGE